MYSRIALLGPLALVTWLGFLLVTKPAFAWVVVFALAVPLIVLLPLLVVSLATWALEFEVPGERRTVCLPVVDVCIEL